jgi:hypothetical protein
MTKPQADAELAWQAFRYLANEMTSHEHRAFEELLDRDQPAREALARMVELSAAVRTLPAATFHWRVPQSLRAAGWMSLGAAACLALMFSWQSLTQADFRGVETTSLPHDSQVALAWSPAEQDPSDNEEGPPASSLDSESSSDFATPSWLMAALTGHDEKTPKPNETEIN